MHDTHNPVRDTNDPREPQASTDPRRWKALAVISVAQFMLILDLTVVNVALPDLGADLDLSRTAFTWAVSAYVLVFGGLLLLGGRFADASSVTGWALQVAHRVASAKPRKSCLACLIIPSIVPTIRRNRSRFVWIENASYLSRTGPSGADQIHVGTSLRNWWSVDVSGITRRVHSTRPGAVAYSVASTRATNLSASFGRHAIRSVYGQVAEVTNTAIDL